MMDMNEKSLKEISKELVDMFEGYLEGKIYSDKMLEYLRSLRRGTFSKIYNEIFSIKEKKLADRVRESLLQLFF